MKTTRSVIDDASTDLEDALAINGSDMSESEFSEDGESVSEQRNMATIRTDLARKLLDDPAYAHRFLCHADGSPCPDGCDARANQRRLAVYRQIESARVAIQPGTGVSVATTDH